MSIVKIALLSVLIAAAASVLRQYKPEYGMLLVIAGSLLVFSLIAGEFSGLKEMYRQMEESLGQYGEFLEILIKVIAITYLCELCAGICKDAGFQTLAQQVELCAKVSVFLLGVPILMLLLEEIKGMVP